VRPGPAGTICRYSFGLLLPALILGAVLGACSREAPQYNLVLICIDTVRYDSFVQTALPDALDPWLERAQIYDHAMASGPWTMPSVASTLTGRYAAEHGAGRFRNAVANLDTDPPSPLADEAVTLAEVLGQHGFRTGAFVAHPFFTTGLGLDQGFEVVRPAKGWGHNLDNFGKWKARLDPTERFFGYLHFMEAHDRHKAGDEGLLARLETLPPEIRRDVRARASKEACQSEDGRRCLQHQVYNAAVLDLRQGIAAVLQYLEDSGQLENTVVMLYSDHGEEFWEHRQEQRRAAEDPRGVYGFGHGQSLYQELLHVPLLAWVPGQAGARHEQLVSLVDVAPSVFEWLRIDDGRPPVSGSALPLGNQAPTRAEEPRAVYASGIAYGPEKIAARLGPEKTVFSPADDRYQYFDLASDPDERTPLPQSDDRVMLFDTLVGDYLELAAHARVAESSQFSDEQIRQLKAIGYLQGVETEKPAPPATDNDAGDPEPPALDETDSPR